MVMDKAGVTLEPESERDEDDIDLPDGESLSKSERVDEDRLSVFRDFINSLDIDDIGKGKGEGPSKS